ncbi:MAG: TolC family protein [Sediminibacterium sp.]
MRKLFTLLCCTTLLQAYAQNGSDKWDLRHCVEYAMQNNISVKQADIQARIAALQARQAKLNRYPNIGGNSSTGVRFGRSIDPTTNTFATQQFLYQNFGVNAGIELYNNGHLKNALSAAELSAKAALTDVDKAANDIALNVANFYLQVLAAKEQVSITQVQISQTLSQHEVTQKRVSAGVLPELNLAEIEAQLASDSSNYYTAQANYEQSMINLRGLLNLDPSSLLGIETPPVDKIPVESFAELQPDAVYQLALSTQPLQKANDFRIRAAQKNILASKALMYPTLSLGGNLSTQFSNSFKTVTGANFLGYSPVTGAEPIVAISNVNYYVQTPQYKLTQGSRNFSGLWEGWGKQLSNNFGQNVGLSLSVPIFNNGQNRIAYQQSRLNLKTAELQKEQSDLKLKQDVYTAYTNAVSALQKFNASKKSVESAQKAYDFAAKRYEVGLLGSLDLITNQNNLLKAKLQQLNNQYDYVFKMKLLEFYKGKGLKL